MADSHNFSRRSIIAAATAAAVLPFAGLSATAAEAPAADAKAWRGLKLGIASYSVRKLPLDGAIKAIRQVGLSYVSIKDFHLPLKSTAEERKAAVAKFKAAGITALSCGVITMNNEAQSRQAFEYARDAGIPVIVCHPNPDVLPLLDKLVKEFDIKLAIHNHGPESPHFKTPYDAWEPIQQLDKRIGLCIDAGHTFRSKVDPAEAVLKCRERLYDMHIRDVEPNGRCIEGGRGVMNLREILQNLLKIQFAYHVGIEYEKDENDPIPGIAETVGYLRGLMTGMA